MMEKDNRSHTKRSRMRAYKKNHYQKISQQNLNNSPIEIGLIDVADSSDDRFSYRSSQWSPASDIDEECIQQIGGDFEILQNMPIAGGSGHFQFSSEKNWETDDNDTTKNIFFDKSEASEYFTLNLALLNAGLQTVPFYKRMDYPGIFNKSDIKIMNQEAEIAETKYHVLLKDHENAIKNKPPSGSGNKRQTSAAKSTKSDKNSFVGDEKPSNLGNDRKDDTELDELLSLTTNNIAKVSFKDGENPIDSKANLEANNDPKTEQTEESKNIEIGNKEDIQQWLDDILE